MSEFGFILAPLSYWSFDITPEIIYNSVSMPKCLMKKLQTYLRMSSLFFEMIYMV